MIVCECFTEEKILQSVSLMLLDVTANQKMDISNQDIYTNNVAIM